MSHDAACHANLPVLLCASTPGAAEEAWALSFEAAAVCECGRVGAAEAACCLASAAVLGRRLDLVPSLTESRAGMALLLRMCSALIVSALAVAAEATAVVAVPAAAS